MYYPRSFLKFILLSFLLVSLPLLYALAELLLSVDRLASQSREEVLQAAQAARTSRLLFEQATTLERVVRQQLILDDPALIDDYRRLREEFHVTGTQLAALPLEPAERAVLDKLLGSEEVLAAKLGASRPTPADPSGLAEGFSGLVDSAQSSGYRTRRRVRGRSGCGSRWRRPASRSRSRSCSRC